MQTTLDNAFTAPTIARLLGVDWYRVTHIIRTRHIKPVIRIGNACVYTREQMAFIAGELGLAMPDLPSVQARDWDDSGPVTSEEVSTATRSYDHSDSQVCDDEGSPTVALSPRRTQRRRPAANSTAKPPDSP